MLGPDVGSLGYVFLLVLSGPILLGMIAAGLASCSGSEADAKLTKGRDALAVAVGTLAGWSALGASVLFGLRVAGSCFGIIVVLLLASVAGCQVAYHTARFVSAELNWYTCTTCGDRFRCGFPAERCERCAARSDRVATEQALADFATHLRDLPPAPDK